MEEIRFYVLVILSTILVFASFSLLFLISILIAWNFYCQKHFKTEKGWDKCVDCGKAESTMFYYDTLLGRFYRCNNCAFKKDGNGNFIN